MQKDILSESQLKYRHSKEISLEDFQLATERESYFSDFSYKPITQEEIAASAALLQIKESIDSTEKQIAAIDEDTRQRRYLKKNLIELQQDQYIARSSEKPMMHPRKVVPIRAPHLIPVQEVLAENDTIQTSGVSLTSPKVVSAILRDYSRLKEQCAESPHTDLWAIMLDFDNVAERALAPFPILETITILKIDKTPLKQIRKQLIILHSVDHSEEYISTLWSRRIPKLIAQRAQDDYIEWYYTYKKRGRYKTCNRCGKTKLIHPLFFTRNATSSDGFYSLCKECRAKRKR